MDKTITFQDGVAQWLLECFGPAIAADKTERADRFIEEALELVQSVAYPAERIIALIGYVYARPIGEPVQEAGGVMVTLASFCLAHGIDLDGAARGELARVWTKIEAIRAKHASKPTGSALPGALDNSQFPHADLEAVDLLITAAQMKNKLYRARMKGRSGWDDPTQCTNADLSRMLREHVEKGDPVDVANFCAFLIARGERILTGPALLGGAPSSPSNLRECIVSVLRDSPEVRNIGDLADRLEVSVLNWATASNAEMAGAV